MQQILSSAGGVLFEDDQHDTDAASVIVLAVAQGADLRGSDLWEANLWGVDLEGAAIWPGWKMVQP